MKLSSSGLEDGIIDRRPNGRYSYIDLDDKEWVGTERVFSKHLRENPVLLKEIQDVIARQHDED